MNGHRQLHSVHHHDGWRVRPSRHRCPQISISGQFIRNQSNPKQTGCLQKIASCMHGFLLRSQRGIVHRCEGLCRVDVQAGAMLRLRKVGTAGGISDPLGPKAIPAVFTRLSSGFYSGILGEFGAIRTQEGTEYVGPPFETSEALTGLICRVELTNDYFTASSCPLAQCAHRSACARQSPLRENANAQFSLHRVSSTGARSLLRLCRENPANQYRCLLPEPR